jgi:hypothetical protein
VVEFRAAEQVTVELRVIRYQTVIAHSRAYKVHPGRWLTLLSLAANVGVGRARTVVRFEDRAGHIAWYRQPIRIPAAPGRRMTQTANAPAQKSASGRYQSDALA